MKNFLSKLAITVLGISLMAFSCQKDEDTIPLENLTNTSQSFVNQYFSNSTIIKSETKSNGSYSVDLSNGVEIDFDATGNWIKVDAPDGIALSSVATSTGFIPQSISAYISANYPNNPISSIEKKATTYEVDLVRMNQNLIFDLNGNFVRLD